MILEYKEFRQLFDFPTMIDLDTFKQSVKVKRNQKIMSYTLDEFITRMGDFRVENREEYWKNLYSICVTNREETLRSWYENNISIDDLDKKMFFPLDKSILEDNVIYAGRQNKSRIIKNINFTGVYNTKKYTLSDNMSLLNELKSMFNDYVINSNFTVGKQFNIVLRYDLNGLFALMRGTRHKASIFNQDTYGWMLDNIFEGEKVLAPTAGWNSYQIGFHQTKNWKEFTCVDVIPSVISNVDKISDFYKSKDPFQLDVKKTKGYCCPSEKVVLDEPNNYYDLILFGPPYYNLELYDGDNPNQSSNAYSSYEEWLEGYWDATIQNMLPYLKVDCPFAFCIGNFKNVFGEIGKEKYNEVDISKDMLDIAKRYLTFDREYILSWGSFTTAKGKANNNIENLFVLRKED